MSGNYSDNSNSNQSVDKKFTRASVIIPIIALIIAIVVVIYYFMPSSSERPITTATQPTATPPVSPTQQVTPSQATSPPVTP